MAPEIVVVGSHAPGLLIHVKRVPVAGETVIGWDYQEPMDGGKGSNQAIAAARLGARVSFVGCVGRDRIGDEGERWMRNAGVDTTYLRRNESASSGVGFIMLDASGVPAMVTSVGANAELTAQEVETALSAMAEARVLLTQFEILPEVALHAARVARQQGMIAIVNPAPAPERALRGLNLADILVPNETEARQLLNLASSDKTDPADMARRLRAQTGVACVLITIGERGVVGIDDSGEWRVEPPRVETVDTSGAGDSFCAALAVALARGETIRAATEWACRVAALSVTRPGTIPAYPTATEVDQFLGSLRR